MLCMCCVLRIAVPILKSTAHFAPDTHKIIWGVVLTDIYRIFSRSHPFPKYFIIKSFCSAVSLCTRIRWVAIDNITIFVIVVSIVHLTELHLGQVKSRQLLKSQ